LHSLTTDLRLATGLGTRCSTETNRHDLPRRFETLMTAELERRRLGPYAPAAVPISAH